jgi:hypothetical protein
MVYKRNRKKIAREEEAFHRQSQQAKNLRTIF